MFGLEQMLNLTQKKRFTERKLYKGQEIYVTTGIKILELLLKKIGCWNLESPGKKLTVGKKCDRWKLGTMPKSEKKLTL